MRLLSVVCDVWELNWRFTLLKSKINDQYITEYE